MTAQSFDHKLAPFARGLFLGNYAGLVARGGVFLTAYRITTASDPANINVSTLSP